MTHPHEAALTVGAFYMVTIAFDPDCEHEWENQDMPARFAGYDDGVETWNFLDADALPWPSIRRSPIVQPMDIPTTEMIMAAQKACGVNPALARDIYLAMTAIAPVITATTTAIVDKEIGGEN